MAQNTIRIDSEVLTVGNLTEEELKKREQQREEAIAYIMQEEPEVTREQAATRYDKWRSSWYEWYYSQSDEEKAKVPLPKEYILDEKGTRYFKESELNMFERFKESMTYGKVASVSRTKWGKIKSN